ncbi:transposase, partial [bacterium]|nr:transposase [bacterium]MBU1025960.1 transposase [bacterium]
LRIIIPDIPYHVTQRGNNGQDVFFSNEDRIRYLKWFVQYSSRYKFDIIAYCLMTNHVHFVGIPLKSDSISRTFQVVNMMHTQSINKAKARKGHLWHSRFYSSPMDEKHAWLAVRYVEQNPVRAGIVDHAANYIWSSAKAHCEMTNDPVLSIGKEPDGMFDSWSEILGDVIKQDVVEQIRGCTMRGLPYGEWEFVKRVSSKMGLKTTKSKPGRPRNPVK